MGKWSAEKSNEWYKKRELIIGCNFTPSNASNQIEMWQKGSFDIDMIKKELTYAAEAGLNSCRVYLHYLVWKHQKEDYFKNIDTFLAAAESLGIGIMFVLLDDCWASNGKPHLGEQEPPIPGRHNSRWAACPGPDLADSEEEFESIMKYIQETIERYKNDSRVIIWDLYNEPGGEGRAGKSVKLLKDAFRYAREINPSQPLTACVWNYDGCVWDSDASALDCDAAALELSDIITFHHYGSIDKVVSDCEKLLEYKYPVICTEWLHRGLMNNFDNVFDYLSKKGIGTYFWGFVAGKTQTYCNWDRSKNPPEGYPEIWQHDLLYPNGTPYDESEILKIKEARNIAKSQIPY